MQDSKTKPPLLRKGDPANPFAFDVLDCRQTTAAFEATLSQQPGASFVTKIIDETRKNPTTTIPGDLLTAKCSIEIATSSLETLTPPTPLTGHRWALTMIGERALLQKLWTGQIIHVADYQVDAQALHFHHLTSDKNAVFNDADYAVAELRFLLQTYLEKKPGAFPIQPGITVENYEKIALQGWKTYGPIAAFACMSNHSSEGR